MNSRGYTLLEAAVVISVLILLISGFVTYRFGAVESAEFERVGIEMNNMLDIAETFWERRADISTACPTTPGSCATLLANGAPNILVPPPAPPFTLTLSIAGDRANLGPPPAGADVLPGGSFNGRNPWEAPYFLDFNLGTFAVRTCVPNELIPNPPITASDFGPGAPVMRVGCVGCPAGSTCVRAARSHSREEFMSLLQWRRFAGE